MSDYEKARAELLENLQQFQNAYCLGYDAAILVKRLIEELELESIPD